MEGFMAQLEHVSRAARLAGAAALVVLLTAPGAATAGEALAVGPADAAPTSDQLACFLGIGRATLGTSPISTSLVVIPPGGEAEARTDGSADTAIYVLEGGLETRFGPGLGESIVNRAGELLYVPAGLPYQPVNLSTRSPARAIIARNRAASQPQVVSGHRSGTR